MITSDVPAQAYLVIESSTTYPAVYWSALSSLSAWHLRLLLVSMDPINMIAEIIGINKFQVTFVTLSPTIYNMRAIYMLL